MMAGAKNITKQLFLEGLVCRRRGWYSYHGEEMPALSVGEMFRIRQGRMIGEMARTTLPEGELLAGIPFEKAALATQEMVENPFVDVIFEAAFRFGPLATRVDILQRWGEGWHVIEVKSSKFKEGEIKDEHLQDIAYTVMVAQGAGLQVLRASVMLLSDSYRKEMRPADLFVRVDVSDSALPLAKEFGGYKDGLAESIQAIDAPEAKLIFDCKDCPNYVESCLGVHETQPLFLLGGLRRKAFDEMIALGVTNLRDIPAGVKLSDRHNTIIHSTLADKPWQSPQLGKALSQLECPVSYLDFETTMPALPLYPGKTPYETIVTQYSIHVRERPGSPLIHREYLADHERYSERDIARALLKDLGEAGSIVVYSSFEKTQLNRLSKANPDVAALFDAIIERLVDLEKIIKENYYHPAFNGRSSIKTTLPALVPGVGYDDLPVQNGDDASALFAEMAMGIYPAGRVEEIRRNLMAYCKLDTLGMVYLHDALMAIAKL